MTKITCHIVDDEPFARKNIRQLITQMSDFVIVAESANVKEAITHQDKTNANVLFLDIEMSGRNGFELLEQHTPKYTIITSAYPKYAVEGYRLQVFDYLLKPISPIKFEKTINRIQQVISNNEDQLLFIRTEGSYLQLNPKKIVFVEAVENYMRIWTKESSHITLTTLKSLEEKLVPFGFIKIHKSYLINYKEVRKFDGRTVNIFGRDLPVSRKKKTELYKLLNQFR